MQHSTEARQALDVVSCYPSDNSIKGRDGRIQERQQSMRACVWITVVTIMTHKQREIQELLNLLASVNDVIKRHAFVKNTLLYPTNVRSRMDGELLYQQHQNMDHSSLKPHEVSNS